MNGKDPLDEIINQGKVDTKTALIVFAIELQQQRNAVKDLTDKFDDKVATKTDKKELEGAIARTDARVDRLEGFVIKILIGAATILVAGVIGASVVFK